jgi:hypothetical protein
LFRIHQICYNKKSKVKKKFEEDKSYFLIGLGGGEGECSMFGFDIGPSSSVRVVFKLCLRFCSRF